MKVYVKAFFFFYWIQWGSVRPSVNFLLLVWRESTIEAHRCKQGLRKRDQTVFMIENKQYISLRISLQT